jgi:isopentenyl phosphate kinase
MREKKWIIVKLGGCVIKDKSKIREARQDIIQNLVKEIIESNVPLILIHGGGSYGHPIAKQYAIVKGIQSNIPQQILGLTQTHQAMEELNQIIVKEFQHMNYPIMPIQPSAVFSLTNELEFHGMPSLQNMLKLRITPILYGDILFSEKIGFTILSGDQIIWKLCQCMANEIQKIIFTIDKDGLIVSQSQNGKSLEEIIPYMCAKDLGKIPVYNPENRIDVTNGIVGKFDAIKKICQLDIPVQIINGLKTQVLKNALLNQEVISTYIHR